MNNSEELNSIFMEVFSVGKETLNDEFNNQSTDEWDSIHHLSLVAAIEDKFGVLMDPEDIIALTSYKACKELLTNKYGIEF